MSVIVHTDLQVIDNRLDSMSLSKDDLHNAVYDGYLHRIRLNQHHPKIYYGLQMWAESVASLRGLLIHKGWRKNDDRNYERTIHEKLGLAIIIASGDTGTGLPEANPSNKCIKGANTVNAINTNQQLELFPEMQAVAAIDSSTLETWVLLHYIDDDEIRIELSFPSKIDRGRIVKWHERLILPKISLGKTSSFLEQPETELPDIDIEIRRRRA